ncbi:hypothetical protein Misp03_55970 [Microbispora sp. NBRC 16548]|nr:hypothetical protein Misp03_55970 [Microbispora sp. NBRC 16548]
MGSSPTGGTGASQQQEAGDLRDPGHRLIWLVREDRRHLATFRRGDKFPYGINPPPVPGGMCGGAAAHSARIRTRRPAEGVQVVGRSQRAAGEINLVTKVSLELPLQLEMPT